MRTLRGAGQEQFSNLLPELRLIANTSHAKKKPKLLVVTKILDVGGSEYHIVRTFPHLVKKFDVSLFVINSGGKLESELKRAGVPIFTTPQFLAIPLRRIWAIFSIGNFVLKNREAILHFYLPEAYLIGGLSGVIFGCRNMVMSRRSLNLYQRKYKLLALIERWLHKRMRLIVGNSIAVTNDLKNEGVQEQQLKLLYNGIDVEKFRNIPEREELRTKFGLGKDELVIITVANLIPYKGHKDLIHALEVIAHKLVMPWRLLLVGRDHNGHQIKLQQLAVTLGLGEHVQFIGQSDQIPQLNALADIGVLPSHQEGFSNSILEGMAAGLAMVVTKVGGNAEAVIDKVSGLVVPAHSSQVLGEAILLLANDPEKRKAYGWAARQRVKTHFSLEGSVMAYEDLYQSLINMD